MATTVPVKRTESIFDQINALNDRIMKRAFEIFDGNGHVFGRELEDWFKAEGSSAKIDGPNNADRRRLQLACWGRLGYTP